MNTWQGFPKWVGLRESPSLPKKLACQTTLSQVPLLFCLKSDDFVIFMQFLASLLKLPPYKSTSFGKPCMGYNIQLINSVLLIISFLTSSKHFSVVLSYPIYAAPIYLFKVNDGNTRTLREIWLKLIKIPERLHWRRSGFFMVNFIEISHIALLISLLNLNK